MKNLSIAVLWKYFKEDSLFRNSLYLMLSTGVMAVLGFVFWIFVARLFSTHDVGIATTLISATAFLGNLSLLGFNLSLIRYLPISQIKNEKINVALTLILIASTLSSIVFIAGIRVFSPQLGFLQGNVFYILSFTLFVIATAFNTIVESIFIAHRASGNILVKNIIFSVLKLILPIILIFLGSYGIFASVSVATLISTIFGICMLLFKYAYRPAFNLNKDVIKEMAFFSGGNYISGFFSSAPSLILPLLIVNLLNAETAAYYYVSSMIVNFLTIVAQSTTQSLLAEGSHDASAVRKHFVKALQIIFLFLIPAILMIVLFGNLILHAFGKAYATEAFTFLRIVSINTIFSSICSLGNSLLRLRHKITELIFLNVFNALFTLGILYIFIPHGLVVMGWSMLFAQVVMTLIYFLFFWKKKLL